MDAATATARFAALGVYSTQPIIECHDARKRPGPAPSWCIVLKPGARIPSAAWAELQPGAFCSGRLYIVQFKGS